MDDHLIAKVFSKLGELDAKADQTLLELRTLRKTQEAHDHRLRSLEHLRKRIAGGLAVLVLVIQIGWNATIAWLKK